MKTECHKLKDDQLIELLILVPETWGHSDSLVIVTAVVELMIVNNLRHHTAAEKEGKISGSHLLQWIILSPIAQTNRLSETYNKVNN